MSALRDMQDAMQDWLLHGDDAIDGCVDGGDSSHRLRIYADAYRLRLIEILGNDFPTTRVVLGEDGFHALAHGYLQAHPSSRPSVRHFGHAFADWLATRDDVPRELPELARFEWTQGKCFDAADAPALGIAYIAALPADAWPTLQLRLQPCVRVRVLHCNASELGEARQHGAALPVLCADDMSHWLLWRSAGDVQWRRLEADEALALRAIAAGDSFARLCERLDDLHEDGALRAASLLKRWLADGLLAAS